MKNEWRLLAAVCALVIGIYAVSAQSGFVVSSSLSAAGSYYNLMVQGFRAGQLNLRIDVPPGLARLADPYDPVAHSPYPVTDMSYYKGKLYLYFGVTPALILFWPYVALTGHYLPQKDAAVIFCLVGFLAGVGLLYSLWRRYFEEVSVVVVAAAALALGFVNSTPLLLARCDVYEVAVSCGYALTMLALAGIWKALHDPSRRCGWLAVASLAYGLAVGARPSLLFGAVVLLVPVARARRERQNLWGTLLAATGPIMLIGLGLMLYNYWRFDSPWEFGTRYQLIADQQAPRHFFGLSHLWFNFRLYFLTPARWSRQFPFVHGVTMPALAGVHGRVEQTFGVPTSIPLVWLALAAPLSWRGRSAEARSNLMAFVVLIAVLFGIVVLTLCLFFASCSRYEAEFLSALVLLAVVGILSVERALSSQPLWRRAARWGWGFLLALSVAFSLLETVGRCAEAHNNLGMILQRAGRTQEALGQYERALRLKPNNSEVQYNVGLALAQSGRWQEAIGHYEQALRLKPDFAEAHNSLGAVLMGQGQLAEAISQYEQALRIKPDFVDAHYNLGNGLLQAGNVPAAIGHYTEAVRLKPDFVEAHNNLGLALARSGRIQEAMEHWEQALRINPGFADAHYNLGIALEKLGRAPEAIEHYQQALKLRPDYTAASHALARLQAGQTGW